MAIKKLRRDVGGETWVQFQKGCRKYHVKFWEKDLSLDMPPAFMRESISLYDEK